MGRKEGREGKVNTGNRKKEGKAKEEVIEIRRNKRNN